MKRAAAIAFALHAALVAIAALTLVPLLWMVSASFMATGEANTLPPRLLPSCATLEHYAALFTRLDLARSFVNSGIVAVVTTLLSVLFNGAGRVRVRQAAIPGARARCSALLLAALVIPAQVGMLPLFLMLKRIGLVNTLAGVMIPGLAPIFGIFMVRQYALGIPDELLDAARIDGAGELRIFCTVVLPVLRPILVTLAAFTFLATWNDFLWPLIMLSRRCAIHAAGGAGEPRRASTCRTPN